MKKTALLVPLLLFGCMTATITNHKKSKLSSSPSFKKSYPIFLWGLAGVGKVDTKKKCPKGIRQIQTEHTFLDGFLGALTFGIYSPKSIKIWCKK